MKENDFFESIIENLYDGVYYADFERRITLWNRSAERISGFSKAEVLGHRCMDNILRHIDKDGNELCLGECPLAKTLLDGKVREADVFLHHKEGHRVPVSVRVSPIKDISGRITGAVEIFADNSKRNEIISEMENLKREVFLDHLTQIGNRRFGEMNIVRMMEEFISSGIPFGVIIFDVDHFKKINDIYGHPIGDRVLKMVAQTANNVVRRLDTLARWGGEEFLILIPNTDNENMKQVAERIRIFIERSWIMQLDEMIRVTVSIGGTVVAKDDTTESVLERADSLLYRCKESGRNCSIVE